MTRATLHHGKSWWVISDAAAGFNEMRNGFATRDEAVAWAEANGFTLVAESQATAWDNLCHTWRAGQRA